MTRIKLWHLRIFFVVMLLGTSGISQTSIADQDLITPSKPDADEEELRNLTAEYFSALAKKDWQYLSKLFLKTRIDIIESGIGFNYSLDTIQKILEGVRIDLLSFSITKVVINGDQGSIHLTISIKATDPVTGDQVLNIRNISRVLYFERLFLNCLKQNHCSWRIRRDCSEPELLASVFLVATTGQEKRFIISGATYESFGNVEMAIKKIGLKLLDEEKYSEAFETLHAAAEILNLKKENLQISKVVELDTIKDKVGRNEQANDKSGLASSLCRAGAAHHNAGFFKEASTYYLKCLSLSRDIGDQEKILETYKDMAEVYMEQGEYNLAIEYFRKSLDQYDLIKAKSGKEGLPSKFDASEAFMLIGLLFDSQGEAKQALEYYRKAEEKLRDEGNPELEAGWDYWMGLYYLQQGHLDKAIESYKRALAYAKQLKVEFDEKPYMFVTMNWMLSMLYLSRNDYKNAAAYLEESRTNLKNLNEDIGFSDLLDMMEGALYNIRVNENIMRPKIQRMMDKLGHYISKEHSVSDLLNTLALEYVTRNNFSLAEQCFLYSLKLAEESGDKTLLGRTYIQIAVFYSSQGNSAKSIEYYEKVIQFGQTPNLTGSERMAINFNVENALHNMASHYLSIGEYEKAIEYYGRILNLKQFRIRMFDDSIYYHIAAAYLLLGKYNEAIKFSRQAITLAAYNDDRDTLSDSYDLCGMAHWRLDQPVPARQSFEKSVEITESTRPLVAGGEQSLQHFFEDKLNSYHHLADLLIANGEAEEAFNFSERSKSRVLLDILRHGRKNFRKYLSFKEQSEEQRLRDQLYFANQRVLELQSLGIVGPQLMGARTKRLEARLDYEILRAKLYVRHPDLAIQSNYSENLIKVQETAGFFPSDQTALLEFLVTKYRTFLFVLTKNNERVKANQNIELNELGITLQVFTLEISEEDLKKMVEEFHQRVAHPYGVVQPLARKLYHLLLEPAQEQLARKTSLVIVPDGILWELPFQALQPTDEHYLLEDYILYFAPSLTTLNEMQNKESRYLPYNSARTSEGSASKSLTNKQPNLLAIGISEFGKQSATGDKHIRLSQYLPPLNESEKLAKRLALLYGASHSTVYTGTAANEGRIKAVAKKFRILHFGSHGLLDDDSPMYSRIVLSQAKNENSRFRKAILRKGRRFRNSYSEDGMLEAWELMDLELNADLTILSACNTGSGRIGKGEGMVGMAWTLFIAGCPATIVSLWQVDEKSTTDLMFVFHKFLVQKRDRHSTFGFANALRRAALKIKSNAEYRHPYYWACFVVIGDGDRR